MLFNDNFNVTGSGDANGGTATRQAAGLLGALGYVITTAGTALTGQLTVHSNVLEVNNGGLVLNKNLNGTYATGGMKISFDLNPSTVGAGDGNWASIGLGWSNTSNSWVTTPPFGILFRGSGQIQVFSSGSDITGSPTTPTTLGGTTAVSQMHHFDIVATDPSDGNPFDGSGTTQIDVYQDGYKIYTHSFAGSAFANNFVSLGSCAGYSEFDNFQVFGNAAAVTTPNQWAMTGTNYWYTGYPTYFTSDTGSGELPSKAGDVARFYSKITSNSIVHVYSGLSVGTLDINNTTYSYTFDNASTVYPLTMDNNTAGCRRARPPRSFPRAPIIFRCRWCSTAT